MRLVSWFSFFHFPLSTFDSSGVEAAMLAKGNVMPRYLPEQQHVCHVCRCQCMITTTFDPDAAENKMTSQPKACPQCGAPVRSSAEKDIGAAKNLVLTHYGLAMYRKEFGSPTDFLLRHSRTEQDIDAYLALVGKIDFAAWEQNQRQSVARGEKLSADEQAEHKVVPQARAEAAAGTLMAALQAAAHEAKAVLVAERTAHDRRP